MLIAGTASIKTIFHDHLFFSVAERHPWFVRKTEYHTPPAPVPRSGTTAMLLIMSWWTNQKTPKKRWCHSFWDSEMRSWLENAQTFTASFAFTACYCLMLGDASRLLLRHAWTVRMATLPGASQSFGRSSIVWKPRGTRSHPQTHRMHRTYRLHRQLSQLSRSK